MSVFLNCAYASLDSLGSTVTVVVTVFLPGGASLILRYPNLSLSFAASLSARLAWSSHMALIPINIEAVLGHRSDTRAHPSSDLPIHVS
jgi:hypothetical protein